ncbi:MAG TPA: homocysteine S-methyltransferase, partial [Brevibacterium sp.]|nr:homocysteine S-methyltransferase [Brevibacterium sp.]
MTFTQMLTLAEAAAPIVIDGGLGSAAEDRGIDLDHALWSAELIRRDPDTLLEVHTAFVAAGARILTTASYQATPRGFADVGISHDEGHKI